MTTPSWRMTRFYLAAVGTREARFEPLDIDLRIDGDPVHNVLWADNGTGKTKITALLSSLWLPRTSDFLKGSTNRSLGKIVRGDDTTHVVVEAVRGEGRDRQRLVAGMVVEWKNRRQDLDNQTDLERHFYGWVTDDVLGPGIDDLPFRNGEGRWVTRRQFTDALAVLPLDGPTQMVRRPTGTQKDWAKWLETVGIDQDQLRAQKEMNADEGGIVEVIGFSDADDFVRWLLRMTSPRETIDELKESIGQLAANALLHAAWSDEADLWDAAAGPLGELSSAHDLSEGARARQAEAHLKLVQVRADLDTTVDNLRARAQAEREAAEQLGPVIAGHATRSRRAGDHALAAQAHLLDREARAAEAHATALEGEVGTARVELDAWRLVPKVRQAARLEGRRDELAALVEEADKEARDARARATEAGARYARALTAERDRLRETAQQHRGRASEHRERHATLTGELADLNAERGSLDNDERRLTRLVAAGREAEDTAVSRGLAATPDGLDTALASAETTASNASGRVDELRDDLDAAKDELRALERDTAAREKEVGDAEAEHAVAVAHRDEVRRRVTEILDHPLLGLHVDDPWAAPESVRAVIDQARRDADRDRTAASARTSELRRVADAIADGGLLPPSETVATVLSVLDAAGVAAHHGMRALADTLPPDAAAAVVAARPDAAAGVVLAHADDTARARDALADVDVQHPVRVGTLPDDRSHADDRGFTVLPPAAAWDESAAADHVATVAEALAAAADAERKARRQQEDALDAAQVYRRLLSDHPDDPRPGAARGVTVAAGAVTDARARHEAAVEREGLQTQAIGELAGELAAARRSAKAADEAVATLTPLAETSAEGRDATTDLADRVRPGLERVRAEIDTKSREADRAAKDAGDADKDARDAAADADNLSDRLQAAGLTATTDGDVPDESLDALAESHATAREVADAAMPTDLAQELEEAERALADLDPALNADPDATVRARELAETADARNDAAALTATRAAEERLEDARSRHAVADHAARQDRERADEHKANRDITRLIEGKPVPAELHDPRQLRALQAEMSALARVEGEAREREEGRRDQHIGTAEALERDADRLADPARTDRLPDAAGHPGTVRSDLDQLVADVQETLRAKEGADRDAATADRMRGDARDELRNAVDSTVAHNVTGRDGADPDVVALVERLRTATTADLAADAGRLVAHLADRAQSLRRDIEQHDAHVGRVASILRVEALAALGSLREYENASRLPGGMGDWSEKRFVLIKHDEPPTDTVALRERIRDVVVRHIEGTADSSVHDLLFGATRALVGERGFTVRIFKPLLELPDDRVEVSEMASFSGGQKVTAAVLLYSTMMRVRARRGAATTVGWLWLDNPFGRASADVLVRVMRKAADRLGLQLLFTAAPKDKSALAVFDKVHALAPKTRPGSTDRYVTTDDATKADRSVEHIDLVQRQVEQVLGA